METTYIVVAAVVAVMALVVAWSDPETDRRDAERNALRIVVPVFVAGTWPLWAAMAAMAAGGWLIGAGIRAFHYRKEWNVARAQDAADLAALQTTLSGHDVWIFGSSVKARPCGYAREAAMGRCSHEVDDVDLVVVVGQAAFTAWTALAFNGGQVDRYNSAYPTRTSRLAAANRVLRVELPEYADVFLFTQDFVDGTELIPAWEGRFRNEVLAARKRLSTLRVAPAAVTALLYGRNQ